MYTYRNCLVANL